MKKKIYIVIIFLIVIICTIGIIIKLNKKEDYPLKDKNTLYVVKFEDTVLRFERIDYSLGQNQLVVVEKSDNKGKTFKRVTKDFVTVSMKPKFIFLNKNLGFAISKENLTKSNNYMGIYVTSDGGKTFNQVNINYDEKNNDILTIEKVPYYDKNILKLPCSIYKIKEDNTGYEDVYFDLISEDNGLNWHLKNY